MSRVTARTPMIPIKRRGALSACVLGLGMALGCGLAGLGAAEYTVKAGDSLYVIAKRNSVSVEQLRSWNGLKNDMIHPGQKLVVSQGESGALTPSPEPAPATPRPASAAPGPAAASTNLPGGSGMLTDKLVTDLAASPALNEYLYTVQEGDSLAVIAKRFGTSVKAIQWINDLGSDVIRIEQQLLVPTAKGDSGRGKLISSHGALPADEQTHAVAKGESLSTIASEYKTTVTRLRWRNGLKSNALTSGQQLIIPGQSVSNSIPTPIAPTPAPKLDPVPTPTPAPTETVKVKDLPPPTATIPEKVDSTAQETLARSGDYLEFIHTVQKGETVATVAAAKGSTEGAVRWLNDLGTKEIQEGQVIIIPTFTSGEGLHLSNRDPLPASGPSAGTEISHEVAENDALAVLAMQYNTTLARLRWRNKLPSNDIRVGQKLVIVTTRPPAKQGK